MAGVSDILSPGLKVVFCGLNPAGTAARSGHNFSSGSNRFWPVLHLAGFTPVRAFPLEALVAAYRELHEAVEAE